MGVVILDPRISNIVTVFGDDYIGKYIQFFEDTNSKTDLLGEILEDVRYDDVKNMFKTKEMIK